MAILKLKNETTKEWEDVITIKGDKGDKPTHEIDGTKIRFQNPDGAWGEWIELEVLTAEQVPTSDGSNVQTKLDNSVYLNSGVTEDSQGNQFGLLETGIDGIFTYEKYADGRLKYFVNATTAATITTANGGVYISGLRSMASNTYPIPFVGTPTVVATVGGNGHTSFCWLGISDNLAAKDAPPDFYICRGNADSESRSYRVGMIIEGRWK